MEKQESVSTYASSLYVPGKFWGLMTMKAQRTHRRQVGSQTEDNDVTRPDEWRAGDVTISAGCILGKWEGNASQLGALRYWHETCNVGRKGGGGEVSLIGVNCVFVRTGYNFKVNHLFSNYFFLSSYFAIN